MTTSSSKSSEQKPTLRAGRILAAALAAGIVVAVVGWFGGDNGEEVEVAGGPGEAGVAQELGEYLPVLQAAEELQRQGRLKEAVDLFVRIPQSAGKAAVVARIAAASTMLHEGFLVATEKELDRLAEIAPGHPNLIEMRSSLLTASGRRWESRNFLKDSIALNLPSKKQSLIYLSTLHQMPAPEDEYLAKVKSVSDAYGKLSMARLALGLGLHERALELLVEAKPDAPNAMELNVQISQTLLDAGRPDAFATWQANLPKDVSNHPVLWQLRGRFAQERGDSDAALRCYWESLKLDPNIERSCYQIGQLLAKSGKIDEARPYMKRAGYLSYLHEQAVLLYDGFEDADTFNRCAAACVALGRFAEAIAWSDVLEEASPGDPRVAEIRRTIPAELATAWLAPGFDLADQASFASLPLPEFKVELASQEPSTEKATTSEAVKIGFVEEAASRGIAFQYQNAEDDQIEGKRMFEYTGGGVGVLDFDNDSWPDLYLTQGSELPPGVEQTAHGDAVYRNIAGERFVDVTTESGVSDYRFGQGIAVGDLNSDGFPDLRVSNIDGSRLLINNGDGTFTDVTEEACPSHPHWSTSCAIADLNGDGLADIYDTTFLQGENVFSITCKGRDGVARSCAPKGFEAAPDYVYLNQGDGRFEPVGAEQGFDVQDGDGLGIVVADFSGQGQSEVFIANDGRPNFFFQPVDVEDGRVTSWEESALFSGLAHDADGASQACMGVAADDINHDGRVDLFVTNFFEESNTLYMNMGQGAFLDQTISYGLREPSLPFLGFGTQFIDADLDGWTDIALVNGHVDDFTHRDLPYKMRPQFFRNLSGERFEEMKGDQVGEFFDTPRLGRSMAKLDWNGDLKEEFVVSNLLSPVTLLRNTTDTTATRISFRLVGTSVDRDAAGTRVKVQSGDFGYERQLTVGDGYQCANERRLLFGLGDRSGDVNVTVKWSDDSTEVFDGLTPGRHYTVVQGNGVAVELPDRDGVTGSSSANR